MERSNRALYLAGLLNEEGGLSSRDPRFETWLTEFEEKFPTESPSGLSHKDLLSLYVGRVIAVLDEFGETSQWDKYAGFASLERIVMNYKTLIERLVKTHHSEMYQAWWDYNNKFMN